VITRVAGRYETRRKGARAVAGVPARAAYMIWRVAGEAQLLRLQEISRQQRVLERRWRHYIRRRT